MLIEFRTTKPMAAIDEGLRAAAARHKFGVLAVHNLQETMRSKGVDFDQPAVVYEVCQPLQAKKVLTANAAIATALPCRISVYADGDALKIATIKPTMLLQMFGAAELAEVAQEVEKELVAMMREAAE